MLPEVVRCLRCPHCATALARSDRTLRCDRGHAFDLAREGYVNLLRDAPPAGTDTAEMVAARAAVLSAGHFDFIIDAVTTAGSAPAHATAGLVLDAGAGTGHYLAAVLDAWPDAHGLALDLAKTAVRRAARAHPRAAAAVCDVWRGLPVADGCVDVVLNVFAPRNGAEFRRVLRPDGRLVVVTPTPGHLAELVPRLGLIGVDPDKDDRLERSLGPFRLDERTELVRRLSLPPDEAANLVAMGPSAWHIAPAELAARLGALTGPVDVTASVTLRTYRPA